MQTYLNGNIYTYNKMRDISLNVTICVNKDWDEVVNDYCKKTGRVKSRLIQIAVENYMKENK